LLPGAVFRAAQRWVCGSGTPGRSRTSWGCRGATPGCRPGGTSPWRAAASGRPPALTGPPGTRRPHPVRRRPSPGGGARRSPREGRVRAPRRGPAAGGPGGAGPWRRPRRRRCSDELGGADRATFRVRGAWRRRGRPGAGVAEPPQQLAGEQHAPVEREGGVPPVAALQAHARMRSANWPRRTCEAAPPPRPIMVPRPNGAPRCRPPTSEVRRGSRRHPLLPSRRPSRTGSLACPFGPPPGPAQAQAASGPQGPTPPG
jgi:hypothetical protein